MRIRIYIVKRVKQEREENEERERERKLTWSEELVRWNLRSPSGIEDEDYYQYKAKNTPLLRSKKNPQG